MSPRALLERLRRLLDRPSSSRWIVAAAVVLALPSLFGGLGADDHHFRMVLQGFPGLPELTRHPLDVFTFAPGDVAANRACIERGILPWWSTPTVQLSFLRPLAAVSHWIDSELWPDNTIVQHLHTLGWYLLLVVTLGRVYRRFTTTRWVAGLATLLYVVDEARILSVAWVATRNSVMSCIAAALVLLAHDRWRRDGWTTGALLGPLALVLGLLCGEMVIGVLGYLVAHAVFLDPGSRLRRALGLLPYMSIALVWLAVYSWLGFGAEGSGLYLDPLRSPTGFLTGAAQHVPVLLLDQFASQNPALWTVLPAPGAAIYVGTALLFLVLLGWTFLPVLRRDAVARFWTAGLLLAVVPVSAVLPQSRLLFLVGFGGVALLARAFEAWLERPAWLHDGRRWTTPIGVLAPLGLIVHLVIAPLSGQLVASWITVFDHHLRNVSGGIPDTGTLADDDVAIVALPTDIMLHGIPYLRSSLRRPSPRRLLGLYSGVAPIRVHRTDQSTLVVDASGTFVAKPWSQMFRGPAAHPFAVGDLVRLSLATIEITAVDERGRATRASFRFKEPLETAVDHWLTWSDGSLVPFELPEIGGTVELPGIRVRRMLWRNFADYFGSGAWRRAYVLDTGPLATAR